jgi:hypothetical protein
MRLAEKIEPPSDLDKVVKETAVLNDISKLTQEARGALFSGAILAAQ